VQLILSLLHACLTVHDTFFVLYFPIWFYWYTCAACACIWLHLTTH